LVTKRPGEIVAAQVPEVIFIWYKSIRDFVRTLVLIGPFLSLGYDSGKLICSLTVGGVSGSLVFDELLPTSFLSEGFRFKFNKILLCSGLGQRDCRGNLVILMIGLWGALFHIIFQMILGEHALIGLP